MMRVLRYVARASGYTLALLAFNAVAAAQCAMCRASLAGSNNAHFIRNLNIGVVVLLAPPVAMFCAIFVALKRHAARADRPAGKLGKESQN